MGWLHDGLWNSVYLDRAPDELRAQDHPVRDKDTARLPAFVRRHIRLEGHYSFNLPDLGGRHRIQTPSRTRSDLHVSTYIHPNGRGADRQQFFELEGRFPRGREELPPVGHRSRTELIDRLLLGLCHEFTDRAEEDLRAFEVDIVTGVDLDQVRAG